CLCTLLPYAWLQRPADPRVAKNRPRPERVSTGSLIPQEGRVGASTSPPPPGRLKKTEGRTGEGVSAYLRGGALIRQAASRLGSEPPYTRAPSGAGVRAPPK